MGGSEKAAPFLKDLKLKDTLDNLLTLEALWAALKLLGILAASLIAVRLAVVIVRKVSKNRLAPRSSQILEKAVRYLGYTLVAVNAANAAGFDLSALLGAAGIAGIAIGFAAQTSVSNLISGLFLLTEKAYAVGDVLDVGGGTVGSVDSIDLLSVKLRTFDNRLVRIPNETLVKTNIINITRYPIRRLNINIAIPYQEDIARARQALLDCADANPWVLRNPEPFFIVEGFGANGINLFLGVWFAKENFVDVKNTVLMDIKRRFDKDRIKFVYQTLTVYQKKG